MAKIREKKYSWEYYPDTYMLSRPSESQKNIIRDAEDGPMAKFYDYDEGGNYFTFNTRDFEAHKKDILGWLKRHPEFDVEKGTFEAFYGPKENYDDYFIKYPNDKYIYIVSDYNPFENLKTKPYNYEPKDDEIIIVDMGVKENNIKEDWKVKSPLDYIEDKLNDNGIDYTVEQAWGDEPYDTWITINDGQDSLADEIICSVVGYAYDWVRDKYGNRKYCKVATDEDTINELNESLKGNHSFKGLTKKVVEAKETCSQDYLRYKKQLQKAKSIDELRKVWQTIKKDLDDDMSFEEDKKLSDLFLERKKELKESLQEATGKIQKVVIRKQGNTKDKYKVVVNATNGKKSEEYLSEDDIKPFVNGLKKRYGDFEIEDPSNTLEDNTDLFKETFNDLVEETKRLMQEEDYDIHDAIYEAVSGLFLDKQIKAIKDYYRSLGNKYIEDGDEWYDCLADDIINDIKYGEGLGENLKEEWKPFGGRVADINSSVGKFDYDFFDKVADDLSKGKTKGLISTPHKKYNTGWELTINDCKKSDFKCKEFYNYLVSVIVDWVRHKKAYQFRIWVNIPPKIYSSFNREYFKHDLKQMLQYDEYDFKSVFTDLDGGDKFLGYYDIFISYDLNINLEYYEKIVNREKNDGKNENLKESWIQFTFEDGSNPYVAKTKEEQDRMFKKYKGRVEQVGDITYLVKSEKKKVNEADDRYFSSKPSNDIKIKKFVREYADEIKDDIDNDTYDEYGMWSKYLDMFITDFPKNKLTTSEFAIKFFDEINKRFGSNFHYGYLKEDKDITTDWFVKNDIDNCYYNHKGDRIFETDQELNGRWVFVPKDTPSKRKVFKTLDDAMKYAKNLEEDLDTFGDKMDFLAKDEDEAIDGYKKVIKTVDNKNVKTQLKKIETEEKAHKDYLERVKKNKNIKYTEPLDEE